MKSAALHCGLNIRPTALILFNAALNSAAAAAALDNFWPEDTNYLRIYDRGAELAESGALFVAVA